MMTVRLLVQKKLTTDLWFSPKVWSQKSCCSADDDGNDLGWWRDFWFSGFFLISISRPSNHSRSNKTFLSFFHLSISKWRPSSRFCGDFLFFIPTASGLMAQVSDRERERESDRESVFQWLMQDGDVLRFFFKLSSQAISFGRVTCLHQNVCT